MCKNPICIVAARKSLLTLDDFVVLESPQHGLQRFLNIFFDVKVDVESFHSWVLGWDLDLDP